MTQSYPNITKSSLYQYITKSFPSDEVHNIKKNNNNKKKPSRYHYTSFIIIIIIIIIQLSVFHSLHKTKVIIELYVAPFGKWFYHPPPLTFTYFRKNKHIFQKLSFSFFSQKSQHLYISITSYCYSNKKLITFRNLAQNQLKLWSSQIQFQLWVSVLQRLVLNALFDLCLENKTAFCF